MCHVEEVYYMKPYGIIKFVAAPGGEAPIEIRKAWIGVEVVCEYLTDGRERGAGYVVLQTHAIERLAKRSPDAAKYWCTHGFPQGAEAAFLFDATCVEVIKAPKTYEELFGGTSSDAEH